MHNLFSGPAVIIDDQIKVGGQDSINQLITEIENKHIPCTKYTELPSKEIIGHLSGISFLILDWNLHGLPAGTDIPENVFDQNIDFLKRLIKETFVPIFIFTSEGVDSIKSKLEENDLYNPNGSNLIFVENKSELVNGKLFTKISEWIKKTPSVYVLKEWEKEYSKSKVDLFIDFYSMSSSWPKIIWKNSGEDGVNPSCELGEVITRNLHTRMAPFEFKEEFLKPNAGDRFSPQELRSVLEGERFVSKTGLHDNNIATGDVFTKSGKKKLYINIRAECDCIPDRSKKGATIDDVQLYFLVAEKVSHKDEDGLYSKKRGNFAETDGECIVFCMHGDHTYKVKFNKLEIMTWAEIKDKRIGRLLPPYITRVQQRYSLYLQRQGLPRTPQEAVIEAEDIDKKTSKRS